MVGCETADFLGELLHGTAIVELQDTIGGDMIAEHRKFVLKGLREHHTQCITNAKVTCFYEDGVDYVLPEGKNQSLRGFDTVVLARRALEATREAFEAALKI